MNNLDNDIAAHADVPGLAVAVTRDGKIIYERGFGWADRERGLRATPSTPFALASVSKSITATATMRLSERGSLNLDTRSTTMSATRESAARTGTPLNPLSVASCRTHWWTHHFHPPVPL